jgi:hypothetical protein
MIDEFGKRGICAPAGEDQCSPSIGWDFKIVSADFKYTPGCGKRQVKDYIDFQKKIDDENKIFDERVKEINKIDKTRISERTTQMLDRRQNLVDANEDSKEIIDDNRTTIDAIKEICPDIDEIIKDGEKYDRYRYLYERIESWVYYVDDPSVKVQLTNNGFGYEEGERLTL